MDTEKQIPATEPAPAPGLEGAIIEALRKIFDPEIPVNIFDLGLIYEVDADPSGAVRVLMTLTSPHCPVAGSLPGDVEHAVKSVDGVTAVKVDITWDQPWDPEMMSESARLILNID